MLVAAAESGGAELCSFAPRDWSAWLLPEFIDWFVAPLAAPEFGDAELCSAAPPDVSALPDCGC
ncbi:MAG TPA: hypothetical protein VK451_04580 [Methyloceanibacter sp.]|nr:hypothetical protein [Methyloceanibacter sp.]